MRRYIALLMSYKMNPLHHPGTSCSLKWSPRGLHCKLTIRGWTTGPTHKAKHIWQGYTTCCHGLQRPKRDLLTPGSPRGQAYILMTSSNHYTWSMPRGFSSSILHHFSVSLLWTAGQAQCSAIHSRTPIVWLTFSLHDASVLPSPCFTPIQFLVAGVIIAVAW